MTTNRHCAFCLKTGKVSLCSGCHRRAYCSKLYQTKDWAPGKGGQGHKLWCSRFCGEEDMDWEVRAAAADGAKGLGVFALRDLPRFTRIIVDGERADDHPAIDDLLPAGGSRKDKFELNSLMVEEQGQQGQTKKTVTLYLRVARVNHSCSPNAFTCPDFEMHCTVLMAHRDIAAGEEITIAYRAFNEPIAFVSKRDAEAHLKEEHHIVCGSSCRCKDAAYYKLCQRANEMVIEHGKLIAEVSKPDEVMALTEQLLPILQDIDANCRSRMIILYNAVGAVMACPCNGRHLPRAAEFVQEMRTVCQELYSPTGTQWSGFVEFEKAFKAMEAQAAAARMAMAARRGNLA